MLSGRLTGEYKYHYEGFGNVAEVPVAQNQIVTLATQLDLTAGPWLIQCHLQSSIRNLQLRTFLLVGQAVYGGAPFANPIPSQSIEGISFLSVLDDVRIAAGQSQVFRINLTGGSGGGAYKDITFVLFAFKKMQSRKNEDIKKRGENV